MRTFQWFTKLMKSEPRKKKHKWVIGEDKILDIVEIDLLRHSCQERKKQGIKEKKFYLVRDWFMIQLGLFTGLRVDEMRQLKVGDILIKGKQSSIIVQKGKGDKKRSVWINDAFKQTCHEFLQIRTTFGLSNQPDCFAFSSMTGSTISKRSLQKSFKRCLKRVRLPEKYSIHCLRHTYGTFLLKASRNIKLVKEQLGHASIKTTEIYIKGLLQNTFFVIARLASRRSRGLVRAIHELAILVDKSFLDSPNKSGNDRRKPFRNRLINLVAEDRQEALEKLYEDPIYKAKLKICKSIQKGRRSREPKLTITDDFDSLSPEAWDKIYKSLAKLMVSQIPAKDLEKMLF